jgi:SAM-dependent MidA family methyltransferase
MPNHTLKKHLSQLISEQGPITVHQFMQIALADRLHGYYMKGDPLGREGDFTTAPEISQMFGEMLGVWAASFWHACGCPDNVQLVELGPGRGSLMADLLRSTTSVPEFHASLTVHMVETSPPLKEKQQTLLKDSHPHIHWHEHINSIPEGFTLLVANEFFDALPIHQFIKTSKGWREQLVILDGENLAFTLAPGKTPSLLLIPNHLNDAEEGSVYEYNPLGMVVVQDIAERIQGYGGSALVVDYGFDSEDLKDTLQAVKSHAYHPVLEEPGEADITAHVNFSQLRDAFEEAGILTSSTLTQGHLLEQLGIGLRAEMLKKNADAKTQKSIDAALERLIDKDQMGTLFKCMACWSEACPPPFPFTPA